MYKENYTTIQEFIFYGYYNLNELRILLFIIFLMVYLVTCTEHALIIFLVSTSLSLHSPMYFILSNLSICELLHITNLVPRMLNDLLTERATITIIDCIAQLNILATVGITVCSLYALMSYDRYLAISNPLRYSSLINNKICLCAVFSFWVISLICTVIISWLISRLHFCGPQIIDHFHCDFSPVLELSCSDATFVYLVGGSISGFALLLPFQFVILTYIFIIYTILRIPSATGRKKAFSTCSSHLFVVIINYGTLITIYVIPTATTSSQLNKGLSFIHIMMIPMINPMIYTLRNQDIHKAIQAKISEIKRLYN